MKNINNSTLWDVKPIKLSILVPTRDTVHSHFSYCLAQLYKTTSDVGIDVNLYYDSSTILTNQRGRLVNMAIDSKSDYMLWLDSDMMFPQTTAIRLLEHNKDIVACNYMRRTKPLKTVAYTDLNDWDSWLPMEPKDELVKVQGVGMGCMLVKTDIFKNITKPYFEFTYKEDTDDWHGEDFNLLRKFREVGYDVHIDTILSMDVKHVGMYAFGAE